MTPTPPWIFSSPSHDRVYVLTCVFFVFNVNANTSRLRCRSFNNMWSLWYVYRCKQCAFTSCHALVAGRTLPPPASAQRSLALNVKDSTNLVAFFLARDARFWSGKRPAPLSTAQKVMRNFPPRRCCCRRRRRSLHANRVKRTNIIKRANGLFVVAIIDDYVLLLNTCHRQHQFRLR